MRLIDADNFRRFAHEQLEGEKTYSIDEILEMIDEQPTAYDIEKVVAELEKKRIEVQKMKNDCIALSDMEVCDIESVTYDRAIDIVKRGGIE